jgi:opacity protein-like surface antigen
MKITFLTALVCTISFFGFSQEAEEIDRTGDIVIDPVIGIPNAGGVMLMAGDNFDSYDQNTITTNTSIPVQFGGRLEYMITNDIGIALEGNYEKSGYESVTTYYDSVGTESWSQTKTRFLARFQYHAVQKEHVDFYVGAGIGYTNTKFTFTDGNTDPDYFSILAPVHFVDRVTDPLAARIFLGTRVLFTRNIGMVMEFGLGSGSILNLGLTARF